MPARGEGGEDEDGGSEELLWLADGAEGGGRRSMIACMSSSIPMRCLAEVMITLSGSSWKAAAIASAVSSG